MNRNLMRVMAAAQALGLGGPSLDGFDPFAELDRRMGRVHSRNQNPYPKGKIQPIGKTPADLKRIAAAEAKRQRKAKRLNGLKATQVIVDEVIP